MRDDQADLPENVGTSYALVESDDEQEIVQSIQDKKPAEVAAITTVVQTTPAPLRQNRKHLVQVFCNESLACFPAHQKNQ